MYTGRGPVCGMIMRGGGGPGATGLEGAAACICVTLSFAGGGAAGGTLPAGAAGGAETFDGTAITGGAVVVPVADGPAAGVVAAGGVTGTFGGITTTVGGRYVAATEAGVTSLGAGAGTSTAVLGGPAFDGDTGAEGASALASIAAGGVTGGLTAGRGVGCSAASLSWVMARSTSPGREMWERSILVLISSSP